MIYFYHVNTLKYFELKTELLVGRSMGDITIPEDNKLSGKHFNLKLEVNGPQPRVFITDLESKNKTAVNRTEIPPNHQVELTPFSLVEVGAQQFLLTDGNSLPLQLIDELLNKFSKKPLIKLKDLSPKETAPMEEELPPANPFSPEHIAKKELQLSQLQSNLIAIKQKAKLDLEALENTKINLIKTTQEQMALLKNQIDELTKEVETLKSEAQKYREEIQLKKQKIINLKDFDND